MSKPRLPSEEKRTGQVLLVPRASGITAADKKALKEIGITVVSMRFCNDARLLSAERLPIDSNALMVSVLKELSSLSGYEGIKSRCFTAICKAIEANSHD